MSEEKALNAHRIEQLKKKIAEFKLMQQINEARVNKLMGVKEDD